MTNCDPTAEAMNSTVNTFIEPKKLKLAETKCTVGHVGKQCGECPTLRVHKQTMHNETSIKYLGGTVHEISGKVTVNLIIIVDDLTLLERISLLSLEEKKNSISPPAYHELLSHR